jgi:integrase/recombinase XerD
MTVISSNSMEIIPPGSRGLALPAATNNLLRLKQQFLVGYKGMTRKTYSESLDLWFSWCDRYKLDPVWEVERQHIELYCRWQEEERHLSPATVSHRLSVLTVWYDYLESEEVIIRSPARRVRRPKVPMESSTVYITRSELAQLLNASRYNPQFYLLICLLGLEGFRVSEALNANIADLGFADGHRVLLITRKGGARQTMPLPPRVSRAVDDAIGLRETGPLIISKTGQRVTRSNAYKTVRRLARKAGINPRCHPHALRHTYITIALDAGSPLVDVQDSAGHADPRTTQRYNRNRHSLDRNVSYLVVAFVGS